MDVSQVSDGWGHLLPRGQGVSPKDVVIHADVPEPQGEGSLHKHWPAGVVFGQQLHLIRTLGTCDHTARW